MTPADLLPLLQRRPFVPLRFTMADGEVLQATNPNLLRLWGNTLMLGYPSSTYPDIAERMYHLPLERIALVQDLPGPAEGNGATP